jgi:hypothetical protein
MDADQIRRLKPELLRYLKGFDRCFSRRESREHFSTYVEGQLSDLGEKSCEPIALAAGIPPRDQRREARPHDARSATAMVRDGGQDRELHRHGAFGLCQGRFPLSPGRRLVLAGKLAC